MTHLDEIKNPKLALRMVDHKDKIERRIAAIDNAQTLPVRSGRRGALALGRRAEERLELGRVEEVAEPRGPRGDERVDLLDEGLRGLLDRRVELGQPGHARRVDCTVVRGGQKSAYGLGQERGHTDEHGVDHVSWGLR